MAVYAEEISLTPPQESIVKAFQKQYPQASRFTAIKFCFGRKFQIDRVFPLYEEYLKIIKDRGLENVTISDVLHELRTQKMYIPGTRDRKGAALFVIQAERHVIGQFPPENTIKLAFVLGECLTANLKTQKNGVTLLIDLKATEWSSFDPNFMSEIIGFFQNHIPAAVKNILIWRAPWWIKTALKVVSPFLKEKMRKRIHLCDNLFCLREFISESELPVEFGGTHEYDHEYFVRRELAKTSSEDLLAVMALDESAQKGADQLAMQRELLVMPGAVCALPMEIEERLQRERRSSLDLLDQAISKLQSDGRQVHFEDGANDQHFVPVYDLVPVRAFRLTLDCTTIGGVVTSAHRPDHVHSTWQEIKSTKSDHEQVKHMKEALLKDRQDYLLNKGI